jgi:hypothetical protein
MSGPLDPAPPPAGPTPVPPGRPVASTWAAAGDAPTRLGTRRLLIGFALVLGAVLLFAAISIFLADAAEPPPNCQPGTECGGPPPAGALQSPTPSQLAQVPTGATAVPAGTIGIRAGTPWTNAQLGFEFEYSDWWAVDDSNTDPREVDLVYQGTAGDGELIVAGVPSSEADPTAYAGTWLSQLREWAPDLKADETPRNAILGPEIGFIDGIGQTYAGSRTSAQGGTTPVGVSMVVSSDGTRTVAVILIVWNPDKAVGTKWLQYAIRSRAEVVLKTFHWGATQ